MTSNGGGHARRDDGASGMIGSALEPRLRADGHVVRLVCRPAPPADEVRWDPAERVLDAAALEADVLYRPTVSPLPPFAVRLVQGEMGEAFLLGGQRAGPERLLGEGFSIAHPELGPPLEHVLRR